MPYSHITQQLLNYFDEKDVRIRENPISLGAQLLNCAAISTESLKLKVNREMGAFNFSDVPLNIDSNGVYYSVVVPLSFQLPITIQDGVKVPTISTGSLTGFYGVGGYGNLFYGGPRFVIGPFAYNEGGYGEQFYGAEHEEAVGLVPYDDTLPIPTRFEVGSNPIPLGSPLLFDIIGTVSTNTHFLGTEEFITVESNYNLGGYGEQFYGGEFQSGSPGKLPIPNCLTFSVSNMGTQTSIISIRITGEPDPPAVWYQDVQSRTETIIVSDDGIYTTDAIWSSINQVAISGLPTGCEVKCWTIPFNLSSVPDISRPYSHSAYRDVLFPRSWQLSGFILQETYKRNRFSGPEIANPYLLPSTMIDVAVEPNTNGLFLVDNQNLYYMDRRTPLPNLEGSGLWKEPLFGLNVWYDSTKPGSNRWVCIQPVPYSKAKQCTQYRYLVKDPNGNNFVINPNGGLAVDNGYTGWQKGSPTNINFPLILSGTYIFKLELMDQSNNKTYDIFPYGNWPVNILSKLDLTELLPSVAGIAFDAYEQLWIWTGSFAVQLKLNYDAYIFVPSTRTIYLTDQYDQITIS